MSETKFTTDGKKVIVVGKLNNQETIVQEIFVSENKQEIPSGENFVVKSLHDAPIISWKEKTLKELELRFERDQKEWSEKIDNLHKSYRAKSELLRAKIEYFGKAINELNEDSFASLVDYICGDCTHVVVLENYGSPKILEYSNFQQMYDGKLRLLSVFGNDNGSFNYYMGAYYDHSGGNTNFKAFKNYADAFEYFKYHLIDRAVTDESLKLSKQHGIELPKEKIEKYKKDKLSNLNTNISSYTENIEYWNKLKSEIESL